MSDYGRTDSAALDRHHGTTENEFNLGEDDTMKKYKVKLYATLPCSATLYVDAEDESAARDIAEESWANADWDGADYNTPDGSYVEVGEVEEVQ